MIQIQVYFLLELAILFKTYTHVSCRSIYNFIINIWSHFLFLHSNSIIALRSNHKTQENNKQNICSIVRRAMMSFETKCIQKWQKQQLYLLYLNLCKNVTSPWVFVGMIKRDEKHQYWCKSCNFFSYLLCWYYLLYMHKYFCIPSHKSFAMHVVVVVVVFYEIKIENWNEMNSSTKLNYFTISKRPLLKWNWIGKTVSSLFLSLSRGYLLLDMCQSSFKSFTRTWELKTKQLIKLLQSSLKGIKKGKKKTIQI